MADNDIDIDVRDRLQRQADALVDLQRAHEALKRGDEDQRHARNSEVLVVVVVKTLVGLGLVAAVVWGVTR